MSFLSTSSPNSFQVLNSGGPGSLIGALYSQGRRPDITYDVPLRDSGPPRASTGAYPVRLDGDYTTVLSITNVTDKRGEFTLQINYDGGPYELGLLTANPGETKTFDIRKLRDEQTPDRNGHPFPRDLTTGQIRWSMRGNGSVPLFGRAEVVSQRDNVSSSYSCVTCCPNSFYDGWLDPSDFSVFVGGSQQIRGQERQRDCSGNMYGPYDTSWGSWYAGNPDIATVDSNGLATGISPGTAGFSFTWTTYYWMIDYDQTCTYYESSNTGSSTMASKPTLTGNGTIWWFNDYPSPNSNYPIVTTLTASASNSNSYTFQIVSGSDKAGLGPDLASSYVSSSNQVDVTSRKGSDSPGDVAVTVTVNGKTSNSFNMTVRRPAYLQLETIAYLPSQDPNAQYGFLTILTYSIWDNLSTQLPYNVPINEYFTTGITQDYSGTDWQRSDPNGDIARQGMFTDSLGVFQPYPFFGWNPTPQSPGNPLSSTSVIHFHQQFWVGTFNPGTGLLVQDNTCRLYLDHGAHEDVVNP